MPAVERFWVKYHFKTDQGIEFFTQDEADQMAAIDTDYHRRDLWEAIERGDYPSWSLNVQIMPFEDAANYRFNPFDVTKVWPHGDYPLIDVGRLTLDRNPTDYHTEIEQAAFEPSNLVPGIGPSPDKMLLGRMFSYPDAHRDRIGANYNQLPVNPPQAPVHSYAKDGHMRHHNPGDPVYAPNSKGGPQADTARFGEPAGWHADGDMVRAAYTLHAEDDDWGQPGTLVRDVMDDAARDRLVDNVVGHLCNGVSEPVLERAFDYWRNVDENLGDRIEAGVSPTPPAPRGGRPPPTGPPPSRAGLDAGAKRAGRSHERSHRGSSPSPIPEARFGRLTALISDAENDLPCTTTPRQVFLFGALHGQRLGLTPDPEQLVRGALFHDMGLTGGLRRRHAAVRGSTPRRRGTAVPPRARRRRGRRRPRVARRRVAHHARHPGAPRARGRAGFSRVSASTCSASATGISMQASSSVR